METAGQQQTSEQRDAAEVASFFKTELNRDVAAIYSTIAAASAQCQSADADLLLRALTLVATAESLINRAIGFQPEVRRVQRVS